MIAEKRIRDPIHGFIHFSEREEKIIDGQFFQRLRGIKQLALTCLIYPGAMHTRFEHSLGFMEMATLAFDSLAKREAAALKKNFKAAGLTVEDARQLLRLTAIFHDTGHLPFSHAAEGIFPKGKSHEDASVQVVKECETQLRRLFGRDVSAYIPLLIQKGAIVPPELQILKKLISSQLDVDRA